MKNILLYKLAKSWNVKGREFKQQLKVIGKQNLSKTEKYKAVKSL